jgi:sugar phosphate isomerase/epimerase
MTSNNGPLTPFRIGATSYVIEADLVANAAYLAGKVQDMQLVLFDLPGGPSNLPTAAEIAALNAIGREGDLSYTVHLIADVRLGDNGDTNHESLRRARQVIELTRDLQPWAYVLHLDGRAVRNPTTPPADLQRWQQQTSHALQLIADWVDRPEQLAVENLEGYAPDFVTPVVAGLPVARCVDVGHLWLDGHDPLPWLTAALPQTRVVHLHGLHSTSMGRPQDHQSLHHMAPAAVDRVIDVLLQETYRGVLTLEVFGEVDFERSLAALWAAIARSTAATLE